MSFSQRLGRERGLRALFGQIQQLGGNVKFGHVVVNLGNRLSHRFRRDMDGLLERDIALAAIAAAAASIANMDSAGVFGTKHTDPSGFLLADAARVRH
jgi:hypothetical protein